MRKILVLVLALILAPFAAEAQSGPGPANVQVPATAGVLPGFPAARINVSDFTLTIGAGCTYADPNAAITALDAMIVKPNQNITLQLCDGAIAMGSAVSWLNKTSHSVTLTSQNIYNYNVTSVASSSGSSGAWSIVLNVTGTGGATLANLTANTDYIVITGAANGSNPDYLNGVFSITNVNSGAGQITISSPLVNATAPSGAITATGVVPKGILTFSGTDGIDVWNQSVLNTGSFILVGTVSGTTAGISAQDNGRVLNNGGTLGIYGFSRGVYALHPTEINGGTWAMSGSDYGALLDLGSLMDVTTFAATGETHNGVYATGGTLRAGTLTVAGVSQTGLLADSLGRILFTTAASSQGNTSAGLTATNGSIPTANLANTATMSLNNNGGGKLGNTWTPAVGFASGSGWTYSSQQGGVWQFGDHYLMTLRVTLTGLGTGSGAATMTLPQTLSGQRAQTISCPFFSGFGATVGGIAIEGSGTGPYALYKNTGSGTANTQMTAADFTSSSDMICTGVFAPQP